MRSVLILQNHPAESAGTILEYLHQKNLPVTVCHTYRGEAIPNIAQVDTVINLGCPHPAARYHELDYLRNVYQFVCDAVRENKLFLGICFGGQILAKALGVEVGRNRVKEIGTYEINLTEAGLNDPLFKGFEKSFSVFQWHGDTFQIPDGATNLARSAECENQAFRVGRAVALQFHLDADSGEVAKWCDTYPEELDEIGKTKPEVVESFRKIEPATLDLNFRLLDNFFAL